MADRTTHPHDTSKPAMSAETVPSEEFVLVPREPTDEMIDAADRIRPLPPHYLSEAYRAMIAAAPTLSASHLAKEGGEAALDRDAFEAAHAAHIGVSPKLVRSWRTDDGGCGEGYKAQPSHSAWYGWKLCRAALASLPQPSPTLAKGGDAVRGAMHPDGIGIMTPVPDVLGYRISRTFPSGRWCFYRPHETQSLGDYSTIDQAIKAAKEDAALSTPTEGPASQTEGTGGGAETIAIPVGWYLVPEVATEEQMNAGLYQSSHDSDYASVMQSYMDMVRTPIDLPPPFAALTPPETAEAVPVAWRWRMAANLVWNYQEDRQRIPDAIHEALYAHPDPEAARLRVELERVREAGLNSQHNEALAVEAAQKAERKLADAMTVLETIADGRVGEQHSTPQEVIALLMDAARSAFNQGGE